MPQKLSAMNYIKNNKRRTAVLIVSLALCFVLTYLTQFLLSSSEETLRVIFIDRAKKVQMVSLSADTLGIKKGSGNNERLVSEYVKRNRQVASKLKNHTGVKDVFCAQVYSVNINAPITGSSYEIPMVSKEEVPELIDHMGARLISGRLPEEPFELVVDEATMKNKRFELDKEFSAEYSDTTFKVVGVLDCDVYFGCGVAAGGSIDVGGMGSLFIFSDIGDISAELATEGIITRKDDSVIDLKWGTAFMKREVTDAFDSATKYVYWGIIILLSISLIIVYTMYLRDRHNEWCLYCSIGYSRRTIYFSIMRELLFTFCAALLIGGIIIIAALVSLNCIMMKPEGLMCRYFHPKILLEILCSYVLILGILQLPVRHALNRIRTIDAMDDELH